MLMILFVMPRLVVDMMVVNKMLGKVDQMPFYKFNQKILFYISNFLTTALLN